MTALNELNLFSLMTPDGQELITDAVVETAEDSLRLAVSFYMMSMQNLHRESTSEEDLTARGNHIQEKFQEVVRSHVLSILSLAISMIVKDNDDISEDLGRVIGNMTVEKTQHRVDALLKSIEEHMEDKRE